MKKKLSINDIVYIIQKFRPTTLDDFMDFGLKLIKRGEGCSRIAYKIRGYDLIVKIPCKDKSAKRHALNEYKAYKRITNKSTKKYKKLRQYAPKIYCCSEDGVILMKLYTTCGWKKKDYKRTTVARNLAGYLFPENDGTDAYGDNMGTDEKGKIVFLDMGCFFKW